MISLVQLLGAITYHAVITNAAALSTVTLDYGTFIGLTNTTNGLIYFRGIRYADPPIGQLRWQAPSSPPTTNVGNVDATDFAFACIDTTQQNSGATTSEDCLFGNVYVPIATTEDDALPVLVFFHGGGFESGRTSKYPPENLMLGSNDPFIFATFEYRLGQFGFLGGSAVHDNGTLNAGLLDQKAALQWVQRYIANFGGDPGRVTIWGQSAGAGSVVYHLIGDGGDNGNILFSQAMGDSPPLLELANYTDAFVENLFTTFAGLAGCGNTTGAKTMSCLRKASTKSLATAGKDTLTTLPSSIYPFGPIFDGTYIRERPVDALLNGNFAPVPVLFGSNTDEGANWSAKLPDPANTSSPTATETTVYNFLAGQYPTFTNASFQKAIQTYYPLADYDDSFSLQGQQMYGEMRYICTAVLVSTVFAFDDRGDTPTYEYHWDNPTLGSTHGDELVAFFDDTEQLDPADQALVGAMLDYWTSFVTSGKPVSDAPCAVEWPLVNEGATEEEGMLRLLLHPGNIIVEKVDSDLVSRCNFWHGLNVELDL